jgi:hypothetical protein
MRGVLHRGDAMKPSAVGYYLFYRRNSLLGARKFPVIFPVLREFRVSPPGATWRSRLQPVGEA